MATGTPISLAALELVVAALVVLLAIFIMVFVAQDMAASLPAPMKPATQQARCTYTDVSASLWECAIYNSTAFCTQGGACLPYFCKFPPQCTASQDAVIQQKNTSFEVS